MKSMMRLYTSGTDWGPSEAQERSFIYKFTIKWNSERK